MRAEQILNALGEVEDRYIEELFVRIEQKEIPSGKRKLKLYLVIAAVFVLLSACAAKVVSAVWNDGWFDHFFSESGTEEAQEQMNEKQLALLEEGLVHIGKRIECDGYGITLESVLSDGYRAFAKFVIEAPEGTVLDAWRYYLDVHYNIYHDDGQEAKLPVRTTGVSFLEDEDPTDNKVSMLMETLLQSKEESGRLLEQGMIWSIELFDFGIRHKESPYLEPLVSINQTMTVTLDEGNLLEQEREVLSKPVYCTGERILWQWEFPVRVKVTSFRLRAMSATLTYQEPLLGYWEGITLDKTYLVLKDGTRIEAHFSMMGNHGDHAESSLELPFPVAIEDVYSVEFPGGKQVVLEQSP